MKALIISSIFLFLSVVSFSQEKEAPKNGKKDKKEQSEPKAKKASKKTSVKDKKKPKEGKKIAIDQEGVSEEHLKKKKAPAKK